MADNLLTPREAMMLAVRLADDREYEAARTWVAIAAELRAGTVHRDVWSMTPEEVAEPVSVSLSALTDDEQRIATEPDADRAYRMVNGPRFDNETDPEQTLIRPYVERTNLCVNCQHELIYSSVADAQSPPRWLHRSNYQEVCPDNLEPGVAHTFARPGAPS